MGNNNYSDEAPQMLHIFSNNPAFGLVIPPNSMFRSSSRQDAVMITTRVKEPFGVRPEADSLRYQEKNRTTDAAEGPSYCS